MAGRATPLVAQLGALKNWIQHILKYTYAKFHAFGRICAILSLRDPTIRIYLMTAVIVGFAAEVPRGTTRSRLSKCETVFTNKDWFVSMTYIAHHSKIHFETFYQKHLNI